MGLKKYLPFENYILSTQLSVDEICNRLNRNIEPRKININPFQSRNASKPYEGELIGDTFKISRIINYRNSFLPVIKGQITKSFGQTFVKVKMRPDILVLIFMSFWMGIVGLACIGVLIGTLIYWINQGLSFVNLLLIVPFAMFLFGFSLLYFGFKYESKMSKAFLEELIEGKEII